MWEKWAESLGRPALWIVQSWTHGLCNSSPGVTTQDRLWGLWELQNWDRWDRGQAFLFFSLRECLPLFQHDTKPIDFPLCWVRSRGISCFSVHRWSMTLGPGVRSVRPFAAEHQNPLCVSNLCLSYLHILSDVTTHAASPQSLRCKWKTKLSLPMRLLDRQRDCSSGNVGQEVRWGSWPFILNTTPLWRVSCQQELDSKSSSSADPSLSCFVAIFATSTSTKASSFFCRFTAKLAPKETTKPGWCLFWILVAIVTLWRVSEPRASRWCRIPPSVRRRAVEVSEWARWSDPWEQHEQEQSVVHHQQCCGDSYAQLIAASSYFPSNLNLALSPVSPPLRLVSPCEMTTALPYELGIPWDMKGGNHVALAVKTYTDKNQITRTGMLGIECKQTQKLM